METSQKPKPPNLDCEFCTEFSGYLDDNSPIRKIFGPPLSGSPRLLYETDDFAVIVGLGQIVEGYLLILPKRHYFSMAFLSEELLQKLEELKIDTRKKMKSVYGDVVFFEHGATSGSNGAGRCVDHAHLHVLPLQINIENKLANDLNGEEMMSYSNGLRLRAENDQPYLYYENQHGKKFIFDVYNLKSQYLRKVIALELGLKERWDWGVWWGEKEMLNTLGKLDFWKTK